MSFQLLYNIIAQHITTILTIPYFKHSPTNRLQANGDDQKRALEEEIRLAVEKRTREVLAKAEAETKQLLELERAKRLLAVSEIEDESNARLKEQEQEQEALLERERAKIRVKLREMEMKEVETQAYANAAMEAERRDRADKERELLQVGYTVIRLYVNTLIS